jgi:hypothetical protein
LFSIVVILSSTLGEALVGDGFADAEGVPPVGVAEPGELGADAPADEAEPLGPGSPSADDKFGANAATVTKSPATRAAARIRASASGRGDRLGARC